MMNIYDADKKLRRSHHSPYSNHGSLFVVFRIMDPIMDPIMDNCGTWSPIHDWIHNWRSVNCLIAWIVNDHLDCQGPFTMRPACSPREASMCEKIITNRRTNLWTKSALETVTTSLPSPRPTYKARPALPHCYKQSLSSLLSDIKNAM